MDIDLSGGEGWERLLSMRAGELLAEGREAELGAYLAMRGMLETLSPTLPAVIGHTALNLAIGAAGKPARIDLPAFTLMLDSHGPWLLTVLPGEAEEEQDASGFARWPAVRDGGAVRDAGLDGPLPFLEDGQAARLGDMWTVMPSESDFRSIGVAFSSAARPLVAAYGPLNCLRLASSLATAVFSILLQGGEGANFSIDTKDETGGDGPVGPHTVRVLRLVGTAPASAALN